MMCHLTWHESFPASPPAQIWPSSIRPIEVAHWVEVTTGTEPSNSLEDEEPPLEVVPQPYTCSMCCNAT